MSPSQYKKLDDLLRKQTGKSFDDFATIEEAIASLSFRLNNEQIMANLLDSLSNGERRIIQLWRQLTPISTIVANTGSTTSIVESNIECFVSRLRMAHIPKFARGWTIDATGEPVSPDKPINVPQETAETVFQEWMLVLRLRHE